MRFYGRYQVYYVGNEKELFTGRSRQLRVDLGSNLAALLIGTPDAFPREIHMHIATYFQAIEGNLPNYKMKDDLKRWQ